MGGDWRWRGCSGRGSSYALLWVHLLLLLLLIRLLLERLLLLLVVRLLLLLLHHRMLGAVLHDGRSLQIGRQAGTKEYSQP